ncbi:CHASE3 domain-containing protein [Nocardioides mesophilus]|uniref:CHASE3 domain-containing protein n=1 Tax=Nocardioides mesophilus TaxID=433659 RepID=A0A7G9R8E2_9ACTN|nr:CHASE3 domain-containing protein [Nocardioides mesophilus]QNN51867.1 CHASE3 domain-containing protein [Nocardioides mesophilus]
MTHGAVRRFRERLDSLRFLMYAVVAALLLLLFISAGANAAARVTVREAQQELTTQLSPAESDVTQLAKAYVDQESGYRGYLLTGDAGLLQPYHAGRRDARRLETELRRLLTGRPTAVQLLDDVVAAAGTWSRSTQPEIALQLRGEDASSAAVEESVRGGKQLFDQLSSRLELLQSHVRGLYRSQVQDIAAAQALANTVTGLAVITAAVVALGSVLLLRWRLTRPLTRLLDDVQAVAGGDYDRPVVTAAPTEFAAVAEAVDEMRDSILTEAARLDQAQQEHVLRDERDRVAADLHDLVIQRLFALGLTMTSQAARDPRSAATLQPLVEETDRIIRELRGVIFGIRRKPHATTLRDRVCAAAARHGEELGFQPSVLFSGPIDLVDAETADELVRMVDEALDRVDPDVTTSVAVEVVMTGRRVQLEVRDDRGGPTGTVLSHSVELDREDEQPAGTGVSSRA